MTIEKTGETTMTNNDDEFVINADMSTEQKQQALKKLMEKYGYYVSDINSVLKSIDWSKANTDFAPTFYTILKNGYLVYFNEFNISFLYKSVFDEPVMKNVSVLIDEMKKYGYDENSIAYALENIDWEKSTINLAPTFYTMLKDGDLMKYFYDFPYKSVFDEQMMKNVSVFIDEMKKCGYDKYDIVEALKYIDWEKSRNDLSQIINIIKLKHNSLTVLHYMNYDKPAATYEILKIMKYHKICSHNMDSVFSSKSSEIYRAYEKIYKDVTISNKEKQLVKKLKKMGNANKRTDDVISALISGILLFYFLYIFLHRLSLI